MASVELRPGDTLNIVWSSVQDTPLGVQQVESSFAFSYEELLEKLQAKHKIGKSRKSGSDGARFSRVVALSVNALRKGKWSTGADISRGEVFNRLYKRFQTLRADEYKNITSNAKQSLEELLSSKGILKGQQRKQLEEMVEQIRS